MMGKRDTETQIRQLAVRLNKRNEIADFSEVWLGIRSHDLPRALIALRDAVVSDDIPVRLDDILEIKQLVRDFGISDDILKSVEPSLEPIPLTTDEFFAIATSLVDRLTPHLTDSASESVKESVDAGAWDEALPELATSLVDLQVPVAPADAIDLRNLLAAVGEKPLDLDRINTDVGPYYGRLNDAWRELHSLIQTRLPNLRALVLSEPENPEVTREVLRTVFQAINSRGVALSRAELDAAWRLSKANDIPSEEVDKIAVRH